MVQKVASRLWAAIEDRSKDYIATPKPNGYQSLHMTLRVVSQDDVILGLEEGTTLELQIRTEGERKKILFGSF